MINNCAKYEQAGNELRGRNLTMDRAYTGYNAVTRCSTEFQMTCLGTVQASRKGLPKEFTSTEGRPVGDLKVLYDVNSKISIHSEICGVKSGPPKNVMLMTSMVLDLARSRDDTRRLYLTCLYNYTMGGTDRVDQLIGNMSCRWKSDRWTMNTFAFMLDTARVNSRTVALLQDGRDVPTSRKYGFDLVRDLVTPHILSRMASPGIQNFVKLSAKVYLASGGVGHQERQEVAQAADAAQPDVEAQPDEVAQPGEADQPDEVAQPGEAVQPDAVAQPAWVAPLGVAA